MGISVEKLYEAIKVRRSTRNFNGQPVSSELQDQLKAAADNLNTRLEGVRIALATESPEKVFKGILGSYGKIKGAPMYAAFIGDLSDPNVQEKAGYLGEIFILEATSLGLASCWIGGTFNSDMVKHCIEIRKGEKVLAVSPLGYKARVKNLEDKLMRGFAGSDKRKDLKRLCEGLPENQWSQGIRGMLEAARLAPSAMNRQPWHFIIEEDGIKVSVERDNFSMGLSKRLDCGIAMAHIDLAASNYRLQGTWKYLRPPEVAKFEITQPSEPI